LLSSDNIEYSKSQGDESVAVDVWIPVL